LLDQGPNNQFLQFRVALAKARQLNRTLVLPIWLPHNPKFQHFHAGAPPVPSRDKWLDQVWYPFETAFDPMMVARYVRTIPLVAFRALLDGESRLERCVAPHAAGFESYLRLSRIRCVSFEATPSGVPSRFLGFHQYDHEIGTKDKYYAYVRPAPPVVAHAATLTASLFGKRDYVAAHVRVADAQGERSDCKQTINGVPVPSVSCGDAAHAINHTSMAVELLYVVRQLAEQQGQQGGGGGDGGVESIAEEPDAYSKAIEPPAAVFLATNLNCSDPRMVQLSTILGESGVKLVCAQEQLRQFTSDDNFVASLLEQEICAKARSFVGSKYSTWTDTVRGLRAHAGKRAWTFSFEELWALGVR